jgi:hypothetical protein
MTFNTLYLDGATPMRIPFPDQAAFIIWEVSMSKVKEEAERIVTENPKPNHRTKVNLQAIRKWLTNVDALINSGTPMLPSILSARQTFLDVVSHEQSTTLE